MCLSNTQLDYLTMQATLILVVFMLFYKLKEYKLAIALMLHLVTMLSFVKMLPSSDMFPDTPQGTAAKAFADVNSSSPWQVKAVDAGVCSESLSYVFLFDAIKETGKAVSEAGCTKCCVNVDHAGQWKGEMIITTDGSDPSKMDCETATELFSCRKNENGPPGCDLYIMFVNTCVRQSQLNYLY